MARPIKKGLDYFPLDVDFFDDDKIELINAEFGVKGENIALRLLCLIYRNGYWYKLTEDESLLLAKRVGNGVTGLLVSEIVKGLVKRSFFDERVFNSFQILTSRGVQQRFFEAVERRRTVEIVPEIMLISVNDYINGDNVIINSLNENIGTQSKVKESKVKESKVKDTLTHPFGDLFLKNWEDWKSYKKNEYKFNYKSIESEQAAINELINLSGGLEETAISIIKQSLAKGWKGFFELKTTFNGKENQRVDAGGVGAESKSGYKGF